MIHVKFIAPHLGEPPVTIPAKVRGVNYLGRTLKRVRLPFIRFDPERLVRQAQKDTGLEQFPDWDWYKPFEKLMIGYERESNLSLFGRMFAKELTLSGLRNLLALQAEFDRHPEILSVPIERPLIIASLSRSGTTLLHKLLASHPDARSPKLWELQSPCPAPRPDTEQSDPRIRACQKKFTRLFANLPEMRKIHDLQPLEPDECIHIFRDMFMCRLSFSVTSDVPTYQRWADRAGFDPAYRHYSNVLRCLTWNYPGKRLILKNPPHLLTLPELIRAFPDAGIIMLHRDPRASAGSACSLGEAIRMVMTEEYRLDAIGNQWLSTWAPVLNNLSETRSKLPRTQFHDIDYRQLMRDPDGTAREVFTEFGFRYDNDVKTRLKKWLVDHPKDKHGSHRYSLERYGLSSRKVLEAVKPYLTTFDLKYD